MKKGIKFLNSSIFNFILFSKSLNLLKFLEKHILKIIALFHNRFKMEPISKSR